MIDRGAVAQWVRRYTTAWDSNDPHDIRAAFTQDVEYRFAPSAEPLHGHDPLVAAWLDRRDEAGDHLFVWEIEALDDPIAVIRGRTEYTAGTAAGSVFDNLWVVRLSSDGRAAAFTEWWIQRPR